MDITVGNNSQSRTKKRKKRRAKRKAIEKNESQIMERMDDILEASNNTGDNEVPKMIEKNAKINDEVPSMDQNKMNTVSAENLAEGNANGKRRRRKKVKKKAKNNDEVRSMDHEGAMLNLQASHENHGCGIHGNLVTENECTDHKMNDPSESLSNSVHYTKNILNVSTNEETVLLPDLVEISGNKASSELVEERSGPLDTPMEIEKFDNGLNQVNDEIVVVQGKGSIYTKEIECLSKDLDQSPRIVPIISSIKRKLLVLDVNGLLACILMPAPKDCRGDVHILGRAIFKRPSCDDFLKFCFQNFDVAIWSSRSKRIIDRVVDYLLGDLKEKLLFCWDMLHSTQTGHKTLENIHKPLVCKELKKIWENEEPSYPWKKGDYDESNTLLLDDSPYKALLNPLHTAIFPNSYHYEDKNDNSLGPGGDLRVYLEGLLTSDNVQKYVENHPFGQSAINESSVSWEFYSGVLQSISNRLEDQNPSPVPTLS